MVILKIVGKHTINLDEDVDSEPTILCLGLGVVISFVVTTLLLLWGQSTSQSHRVVTDIGDMAAGIILITLLLGLMWFGFTFILMAMSDMFVTKRIYLEVRSDVVETVRIAKTCTINDTIAVCRAAKEMEIKLTSYDSTKELREDELIQIAKRCQ